MGHSPNHLNTCMRLGPPHKDPRESGWGSGSLAQESYSCYFIKDCTWLSIMTRSQGTLARSRFPPPHSPLPSLFALLFASFFEVELIYNIVLVSGVQHSNSDVCVCTYMYIQVCVYIYVHSGVCVYSIVIQMCVCIHICTFRYVCVCMCTD